MSDVIQFSDFRRAAPRLVHSVDLPRAPRPGLSCGDFVRINSTGEQGWIARQVETARGLVLEVRVRGVAMMVAASGVVPLGAA